MGMMDEVHERLIRVREEAGLGVYEMSRRVGITPRLLRILEEGGYTLPSIVREKIRPAYGLTELESEQLVPLNLRPHGGDYDPYRYFDPSRLWGPKTTDEAKMEDIQRYEEMLRL